MSLGLSVLVLLTFGLLYHWCSWSPDEDFASATGTRRGCTT